MERVVVGDPPVAVAVRRSRRARRLCLRVSGLDGRATLTLPLRTPLREGLAFVESRVGWLRDSLGRVPPSLPPAFGAVVPFEGRALRLVAAPVRAARVEGDTLLAPDGEARLGARIRAVLMAAARDRLAAACDRHAGAVGRRYRRLTLRDPRSRWGSCSAAGDLMFSWRLVMAPPAVLDYVAAHEVAHLVRMDHSPAFWAVVAGLCPDHAGPRAWLAREGAGLHRLLLPRGRAALA